MLTQERLKELFRYEPETGFFYRTKQVQGNKVTLNTPLDTRDSKGYILIGIDGKRYKAHRLAYLYVYGTMPLEIDHDNHIKWDNRWCNLVDGTRTDNMKNCPLRCTNTSGVVGVSWVKQLQVWRASITVNYKAINLGHFKNKEDAIQARQKANNLYGYHSNHGMVRASG